MQTAGVTHAIQIGVDLESSHTVVDLARTYPQLPACIGCHPTDCQDFSSSDIDHMTRELRQLYSQNQQYIHAIGETGLDYHHLSSDPVVAERQKQTQKSCFQAQVQLAQEWKLPLVIHARDADQDMLSCVQKYGITYAIMHSFAQDWKYAEALCAFSEEIYFSFSGILTYNSADDVRDVAMRVPLDRILIETDAPFLTPKAVRNKRSYNEPACVQYVQEKLQEIRPEDPESIAHALRDNSLRVFKI